VNPIGDAPAAAGSDAGRAAAEPAFVAASGLRVDFAVVAGLLGGRGRVAALDGVDLAIARGGALGVIGETGSGKTTLARALLRLVEPTAGRVVIGGEEVTALAAPALRRFRRRAQPVFQDGGGSLDPRLTVGESIAEALLLHQVVPAAAVPAEVARLLGEVGLPAALAGRRPHQLSGGQQQRAALARALAPRPELLIADEPTAALDASLRAQVVNLLSALSRQHQLTLLLITHDLAVAALLCDRLAVMYLGRVVEEGDTAAVLERPRHPYTRALVDAGPPWPPSRTPRPSPLPGEPPAPAARPPGCAFHPRCPRYRERGQPAVCTTTAPPLQEVGAVGQRSACHFAE